MSDRRSDNSSQSVQRQFGRQAPLYASATSVYGEGESLEAMMELASLGRHRWAVDVATGAGYTGLALKPYAEHSILMDITLEMLSQASEIARERGLVGVQYVQGTSETLPFAQGSLDMVSCRFAAHHFDPIDAFLVEVERVLGLGGVFLLADTVPTEDDAIARWMDDVERRRDPTHIMNLKPSRWHTLIEDQGLRITHSLMKRVPLEFYDWVERSGTPVTQIDALREEFLGASPSVKEAFGIREEGGRIPFYWPCLVVRAVKP